MDDAIGLFVPLGAFVMVSWVVYVIVSGIRRWHQQRMLNQFQTKLLERIGSVNELGTFLNTETGTRFLKVLTSVDEAAAPQTRMLRAVQSGAVLATLGIGLYLYGWMTPTVPSGITWRRFSYIRRALVATVAPARAVERRRAFAP
jgi:hypothetical protein